MVANPPVVPPRALVAQELLAAVLSPVFLVAVRLGRGEIDLQVALPLAVAGSLLLGRVPADRLLRRYGVIALTGALLVVAQGPTAAVLASAGLAMADWLVRGRPWWPGCPVSHHSLVGPTVVLLALACWRTDETSRDWGVVPFALVLGVAFVIVGGLPLRRWRLAGLLGAITAAVAAGTTAGLRFDGVRASGSVFVVAGLIVLAAAVLAPGAEWSLRTRPGPLALAAPALVWMAVNMAVFVVGSRSGHGRGYQAWRHTITVLPDRFTTLDAATGIPSLLLGLLGVGAWATVTGRRGLPPVATAVVSTLAGAAAVAWCWSGAVA